MFEGGILLLLVLVGALLFLLFLGVPIAFALGFVSIAMATYLWWPNVSLGYYGIALAGFNEMTNFLLVCVPLFILMAEIISKSGMGDDTYEFLYKALSFLPGGLAMSSVVFGMVFGACCGASTAGAATVGLLSIPPMREKGYDAGFSGALVAFAGALSILIPPSVLFIIYGVLSGISVGDLFIGGLIPGVILTGLACVYIFILVKLKPSLAPGKGERSSLASLGKSFWRIWPMATVIVVLLGSIYFGIATPTESAAVSCAAVFIIALLQKRLTRNVVQAAFLRAVRTTSMIGWVIVGAMSFGYVLVRSGAAAELTQAVGNMSVSPYVIIVILMGIYLIMGMLMDPAAIIMITAPIVLPLLDVLGIDQLWFGVLLVVNMCAGNISPPMGLNIYIIKGLFDDITMGDLFKHAWGFVVVDMVGIVLLLLFPSLATWLPSLMH